MASQAIFLSSGNLGIQNNVSGFQEDVSFQGAPMVADTEFAFPLSNPSVNPSLTQGAFPFNPSAVNQGSLRVMSPRPVTAKKTFGVGALVIVGLILWAVMK